MKHVFLDSTPLGMLTNPKMGSEAKAVRQWMNDLLSAGHSVYLPEVIDYELRRELIRTGRMASVILLDELQARLRYVPITTDAMLLAADLWATARNTGQPTGDPKKLDIDVILAAQAIVEGRARQAASGDIVVATSNVAHLTRFVQAELWTAITP